MCFCTQAENDKQATQNVNIETNNITPLINNVDQNKSLCKKNLPIQISSKGSSRKSGN